MLEIDNGLHHASVTKNFLELTNKRTGQKEQFNLPKQEVDKILDIIFNRE